MMPGYVGIGDDRALGLADMVRDQRPTPRQQALPDQHIVGAVAERHADARRRIAAGLIVPSAGFAAAHVASFGLSAAVALSLGARRAVSASMTSPTITSCGTSRLSTVMSAVA